MESEVMRQIRDDEPLMISYKEWKASANYENTKRWAQLPEYLEGSLWAAFERGWMAAQQPKTDKE